MSAFGKALKRARRAYGVTGKELAERIGVSHSQLSESETGNRQLADHLIRICEEFLHARGLLTLADAERRTIDLRGLPPCDRARLVQTARRMRGSK